MKVNKLIWVLTYFYVVLVCPVDAVKLHAVNVIYFVPPGEVPIQGREDEIADLVKDAQEFFADAIWKKFGERKSFDLDLDDNGEVIVHTILDQKELSKLRESPRPREQYPQYITIIFKEGAVENKGKSVCGKAWITKRYSDIETFEHGEELHAYYAHCFIGLKSNCYRDKHGRLNLVLHELGHTFGLTHNFSKGRQSEYMMSYGGNLRDKFSESSLDWLYQNAFLNKKEWVNPQKFGRRMHPAKLLNNGKYQIQMDFVNANSLYYLHIIQVKNGYERVENLSSKLSGIQDSVTLEIDKEVYDNENLLAYILTKDRVIWSFDIDKDLVGLAKPREYHMDNNPPSIVEELSIDPKGKLTTTWGSLKK